MTTLRRIARHYPMTATLAFVAALSPTLYVVASIGVL